MKPRLTAILSLLAAPFACGVETPAAEAKPWAKSQYKSEGIEVPAATADEPRVKEFGPDTIRAAAKYLDDGAHHWVREKSCIACHSTGVYMVERSALTKLLGKPSEVVLEDFTTTVPKEPGKPGDKNIKLVEIPYITTRFQMTVQAARAIATAPAWLAGLKDPELLARIELMKGRLREHHPVSDRWWMKSLYRDTYHYITYISTAQALRALALCDEIKQPHSPRLAAS